ncbi:GNAT family N-acetyltransferase [Pedobacter flavus]|uniref:GNAT family N-acetyltransferase n=1 Tax=Pedobacter flavus TaxID=3113906 RepID=A0ABU7H120_9SPHI|nr:GNAT family N-acetyltransferase [Pedobacter sp. VNH31]MEE1884913.1 GNAT family N-acetyltransferase [Pedobacter sp. VNH31]
MSIKENPSDIQIEQIPYYLSWQIRKIVFDPNPIDYKIDDDENGVHFGLYIGKNLIGVVSWFIEKDGAEFKKLGILNEFQGKGFGKMLLTHCIDYFKSQGIKTFRCESNKNSIGFYENLGFKKTNPTEAFHCYACIAMELSIKV